MLDTRDIAKSSGRIRRISTLALITRARSRRNLKYDLWRFARVRSSNSADCYRNSPSRVELVLFSRLGHLAGFLSVSRASLVDGSEERRVESTTFVSQQPIAVV